MKRYGNVPFLLVPLATWYLWTGKRVSGQWSQKKFLLLECFLWMGPPCHICCGRESFMLSETKRIQDPATCFDWVFPAHSAHMPPCFWVVKEGCKCLPGLDHWLYIYAHVAIPLTTPISLGGREETQTTHHWKSPMNHLFWWVHSSLMLTEGPLLDTEEE